MADANAPQPMDADGGATAAVSSTSSSANVAASVPAQTPATAVAASATSNNTANDKGSTAKKEIYTYETPWLIYGMNWSVRPGMDFRLAIGSFVEEYNNKVRAILNDVGFGFLGLGFARPSNSSGTAFTPSLAGCMHWFRWKSCS